MSKKWFAMLVMMLLATMMLAACGGSDGDSAQVKSGK